MTPSLLLAALLAAAPAAPASPQPAGPKWAAAAAGGPGAPAAPIAPGSRRFGPPRRVDSALPSPLLDLDSVRLAVMEPNGVFPVDLNLYPPTAKADRYRLSRVETVLRNPFRLEGVVDEVLARTEPYALAGKPLPVPPEHLWPLLDAEPGAWPEQLPGLPGSPDSALARIRAGLEGQMAALDKEEREFLFRETGGLFLEEEEDTSLTPIQSELKRLEEDARTARILELAGRLDRASLVRASSAAWGLQAFILDSLRGSGPESFLGRLKALAAKGKMPITVGDKGADRHRPDRGIWIDLGGDDQWDFAPRNLPGEFLLIVDLGGDDLYRGKDSLHASPGNLGISLLADLGGHDHYLGRNYAFGSALFGYSHVFDAAGHDYYEGRCASLGFAAFGLGVVQDEAGSDTYSASLMSQGASATWGLGLLLDRSGDDRYLARPTFQDDLRYTDHYIHMVQGFATGLAPDYSGGFGILRDQKGNDAYVADIFGQGSGYWYAMGLLLDEAGDDRYEAHQYAQGAGVHIAVGAAVDWAGNDHRASKGVSQGCGHDLGFGLLHDRAGDDNYLGTDKVQGSGSANGLGVLHDRSGKDVYTSLNPEMALGDADMRRDRGSFGFFLDGGGKDQYTKRRDGGAWRVFDGKVKGNGYGLDRADSAGPAMAAVSSSPPPVTPPSDTGAATRPLEAPVTRPAKAAGAPSSPVFAFTPPVLTRQDSLFIVAATGEPKWQPLRDSAEKRLKAEGVATLDYLVARRLTGQTPRQRHYVERVFTLVSDSGKSKAPVERLEQALATAPDSVKVQLLRIGSALGDSAFLKVALKHLASDSVEVRKLALRSLGTYPRPANVPLLLKGLETTWGLERQVRLWALAQQASFAGYRELLRYLQDPHQFNRQWVRQIVAKNAGGDWSQVAAQAPAIPSAQAAAKSPPPEQAAALATERLEWCLLALEMPGPASKAWLTRMLPRLDPSQRRFFASALVVTPATPPPASNPR